MEDLPTRELVIHSSDEEKDIIFVGDTVTFNAELVNFLEDDVYEVQWKYSADGEEFFDIEGANSLSLETIVSMENANYIWRITVVLVTAEE